MPSGAYDLTSGTCSHLPLGAVNKPLLALLCMICSAIVTGVVAVALKKLRMKKSDKTMLAKAA
ncbi:hypothetical protein RI534_00430 [Aeromonas allosaccharophila]|uniref:hypothetical protein n=1 Tax=Aeromonas TaxID=642 RepID=UPI0004669B3F